jgi:imidazole glycerol-phosphate synthase subunit HisF
MYKRRLIPVLFFKDGWMVRSQNFSRHQYIGDPIHHVKRLMQWNVDELIVLDIGKDEFDFTHDRSDYKHKSAMSAIDFIRMISFECRIPLTFGGNIKTINDITSRIQNGADKVSVNSILSSKPSIVTEATRRFGSQAIVASIDYRIDNGVPLVYTSHGSTNQNVTVSEWAKYVEHLGVGEIFINSIDNDGNARGYDLKTINDTVKSVKIPVIACGGAGIPRHFYDCYSNTDVSAVAAGNIFHFTENSYPAAKKYLRKKFNYIR